MNTRYDDLVIALVAAYEGAGLGVELTDEDFAPNPAGGWVKYRKSWQRVSFLKTPDNERILNEAMLQQQVERHQKRCAEVDALPRFSAVTTLDQRILLKARRRASEIIAADTGTSAEQELIKARTALALANDALALAHDLTELNPRNFGSDDVDDLMHEVTEVIKASGKAIAAIERAGSVGPKETMNDLLKPVFDRLVHGRSQGMPEDGVLAGYVKMVNDMLP
jgi:hypothetical protein